MNSPTKCDAVVDIVHLSLDGILQPLGFSQVARPTMGVAQSKERVWLLTLERPSDLDDVEHVEVIRNGLAAHGVTWRFTQFTEGLGATGYVLNAAKMLRLALTACQPRAPVVWARGFPVAMVALTLCRVWRGRLVYDTRGHWVDHRSQRDGWPRPAVTIARRLEARAYGQARAIVSLTELGLDDVRSGRFGPIRADARLACIPTCADYEEFTLAAREAPPPPEIRGVTRPGRRLVGFVGSVNPDYEVEAAAELFKRTHARDPCFHLLCLTPDHENLRRLLASRGVPLNAVDFLRVPHHRMAAVLGHIEWGLLLLRSSFAKRASMPTKLAEFLASGVRPLHHGCNEEVGKWVEYTGSGLTLQTLDSTELEQAAARIAAPAAACLTSLRTARSRAEPHFSLSEGVRRYSELFA